MGIKRLRVVKSGCWVLRMRCLLASVSGPYTFPHPLLRPALAGSGARDPAKDV